MVFRTKAVPETEVSLSESQEMEVGDSDSELSETEVTVALTPSSRKSMVAQLFDISIPLFLSLYISWNEMIMFYKSNIFTQNR